MIQLLDEQIRASRERVMADTIRLVNIPSEEAIGARRVLDTVSEMGRAIGLHVTDYGCGVISLALRSGQPDIGIWAHGDVVPAGDGWCGNPYGAYEHDGCIIGRGATDNKGQLAAIFHLLRLLKEHNVPLVRNPALYVGSNEEAGMQDVIDFLNTCTPPAISLVPDDGFPVGYGGKGALFVSIRKTTPLVGLVITAGQESSPGRATATFTASGESVTTHTPPRHASSPDPDGNMITRLAERLLTDARLSEADRPVLELFCRLSQDVHGQCLGIQTSHAELGDLTVFAKSVDDEDGCPSLTLNIRYPLGITFDDILSRIQQAVAPYGCEVCNARRGVDPYLHDRESKPVRLLCQTANAVTGDNAEPFTLGGGTYAHRLPNAYVFGTDANLPPADFEKGRGGAHGIDEAASVDRLLRAMHVYARALSALDAHPEIFPDI